MLSAAGWRPSLRDEDVLHESGVASCEPTQQPAPNQTRGAFQDCIRESEMKSPFSFSLLPSAHQPVPPGAQLCGRRVAPTGRSLEFRRADGPAPGLGGVWLEHDL